MGVTGLKFISYSIRAVEIGLSVAVLIVVVVNGISFLGDYHTWLLSAVGFESFVDQALLYVIGLEFALMIIKRDPRLVIEVLIFAIARKMVLKMDNGADFLMGTIAIFLLFGARYYFLKRAESSKPEDFL